MQAEKHIEIGHDIEALELMVVPDISDGIDARRTREIEDDLLRLIFAACHPVLPMEARVALTLKLLCGLTTGEIARAFMVPETTMAQRIVRAKRTLAEARVPFEIPLGDALDVRMSSVLEVIYLVFNEGYTATSGNDWMRPALANEAVRLGRILASLADGDAEVHGLVALMEFQASRAAARVDAEGRPVLLLEQDRRKWDQLLIRRGRLALEHAQKLGQTLGPYALQAAIAQCHASAHEAEETDWPRIVALYDAMSQVAPSPVVELNRAVAVSMAFGPSAALEIVDKLLSQSQLQAYHLLPSVRGDLLAKLGRREEAVIEFERAAAMARNTRESELLRERAREQRREPDSSHRPVAQ